MDASDREEAIGIDFAAETGEGGDFIEGLQRSIKKYYYPPVTIKRESIKRHVVLTSLPAPRMAFVHLACYKDFFE